MALAETNRSSAIAGSYRGDRCLLRNLSIQPVAAAWLSFEAVHG